MRRTLSIAILFLLLGCQPKSPAININILDGDKLVSLQSELNTPAAILQETGITLAPGDKILFHGSELPSDFSLPKGSNYSLQVIKAHSLTLITPDESITFHTTEPTVGLALSATGLQIFNSDYIDPPAESPVISDIVVTYRPSRDLTLHADGNVIALKSARPTVGEALANAGYPLIGLDFSLPAENEPLPVDGQIRIVRVRELVSFQEKALPFSQKIEYSINQPAGEQKVLQAGEPGLALSRVRVRYQDGNEVSRVADAETIVREPKDSIISLSSQVQVLTLATPDGQIQYWRAVQMYTTSYSPCRSGTSKCSYGTASGMTVKHGVVAVIPSLFNQLAGSKVYIPGYGIGVIGDVGGGFPDGRLWIDLGFSDADYQSWSGFHTIYFLAPAPANIPAGLN